MANEKPKLTEEPGDSPRSSRPTGSAPRWMQRGPDADKIRDAYEEAEKALGKVGYLLRTTEAGAYMWSGRHKTAVSGMKAMLQMLRFDVPRYNDKPNVEVTRGADKNADLKQ